MQAVGRMLVGGVSVGGVYAVSREQGKAAVEALHRLCGCLPGGDKAAAVVVHVSAESSQFTVRAVVPADAEMAGGGGKGKGQGKGQSTASSSSSGAFFPSV